MKPPTPHPRPRPASAMLPGQQRRALGLASAAVLAAHAWLLWPTARHAPTAATAATPNAPRALLVIAGLGAGTQHPLADAQPAALLQQRLPETNKRTAPKPPAPAAPLAPTQAAPRFAPHPVPSSAPAIKTFISIGAAEFQATVTTPVTAEIGPTLAAPTRLSEPAPSATAPEDWAQALDGPGPKGWQAAASSAPVPTYATTWPPGLQLTATVQRGERMAHGVLSWRPAAAPGEPYEIALRTGPWRRQAPAAAATGLADAGAGSDAGAPASEASTSGTAAPLAAVPKAARSRAAQGPDPVQWTSRGRQDGAGLAPERFAVSRRGQERHAANFQRDKGVVTFAGPGAQWDLAPGMQDRLSWMLQLAAIVKAQPQLAVQGQSISLWVVGAQGDASVWTFTAQPASSATRAHFSRPSRHPYEPALDIWLGNNGDFPLPERVLYRVAATGQSTELRFTPLQPN